MREERCDPKDVALKSFFLGPQAENSAWLERLFLQILHEWFRWRQDRYPEDGRAISRNDQKEAEFIERQTRFETVARELLSRYEAEIPKFSPRYIGHMCSEVSLPALVGHFITLLHNPNNISGEVAPVGVALEDEAVQALAQMVGYPTSARGHFTSGGTVANFEAMIRARHRMSAWIAAGAIARGRKRATLRLFEAAHMGWEAFNQLWKEGIQGLSEYSWSDQGPWKVAPRLKEVFGRTFQGPVVLVPENKHYSWKKGVSLLGLGDDAYWPIALDSSGHLSVKSLAAQLKKAQFEERPVLLVVSVAGTTELGSVDPIAEVQDLLDEWKTREGVSIWHHVDAAYGGFFCTLGGDEREWLHSRTQSALDSIRRAESVTIDPHKLGYVPYASGAILVREEREYVVRSFDSPYIDFTACSDRGPYTLEGSRSAAGAAATWLTEKCIGFHQEGYGRVLSRTLRTKKELEDRLLKSGMPVHLAPGADTNIVSFCIAHPGERMSQVNQRTLALYQRFGSRANGPIMISKTALQVSAFSEYLNEFVQKWSGEKDAEDLKLIRLCLMNPFLGSKEMDHDLLDEVIQALKSSGSVE